MGQYDSDANELCLIEGSICVQCIHRISRTIIPLNYEDYGLVPEDIILPDGTEAPIVHNGCKELGMDLDHIVLNCNKFDRDIKTVFRSDQIITPIIS